MNQDRFPSMRFENETAGTAPAVVSRACWLSAAQSNTCRLTTEVWDAIRKFGSVWFEPRLKPRRTPNRTVNESYRDKRCVVFS